jgi:hypothetical protein
MSQSIKLFFSSTTVTEDGPRKKSRVNEVVVAAVVQTQQLDGTVEPEDKVATSAVPVFKDEAEPMVPPVLESPPDLQSGWALFDNLEPGWKASLSAEFNRPYFKSLLRFLESERRSHTIYPPVCDMFSAFNLCPLEQVKVLHKLAHCSTGILRQQLSFLYALCLGGGDWTRPLPRPRPSPRSRVLRAQRRGRTSVAEEHDLGSQGE